MVLTQPKTGRRNSLLRTYALSEQQVYYFLLSYGPTTLETIQNHFESSPHTLRKALRCLVKSYLIVKYPNLADMRTYLYQVSNE